MSRKWTHGASRDQGLYTLNATAKDHLGQSKLLIYMSNIKISLCIRVIFLTLEASGSSLGWPCIYLMPIYVSFGAGLCVVNANLSVA